MERQYEYIREIAEQGSILKAAERLYVTPSALSKYVQKVESSIGLKLFDRVGKKFVLTYSGERYLYWQTHIHNIQENMNDELADLARARRGRVRIGFQLSDSKVMTKYVLPAFSREFPDMRLELYEDSSRIIRGLLEDGTIDIAILFDYKLSDKIEKRVLTPSNRVIIVPKGSPIEDKAVVRKDFTYPWINLELLRRERFIVPIPNQFISRAFDEFQEECGFKLRVSVQAKFLETRLSCVAQGLGITYGDDQAIIGNPLADQLTLLSYGKSNYVEKKVIAYGKEHFLGAAHYRLIALYEEVYEKLLPAYRKKPHVPSASQE